MTEHQIHRRPARRTPIAGAVVVAGLFVLLGGCARAPQDTYGSPEAAVAALAAVAGTKDTARVERIFGPGSAELFRSGDDDEDAKSAALVRKMIAAKVDFQAIDDDTRVALFGDQAWPFPIPLVRERKRWHFDTAAGRQELLNRRVGYYELATLDSLHEYVYAQREYQAEGRDGNPPAFAQRFRSSSGQHDGLFWPVAEGEGPSPLGPLIAGAELERELDEPRPFRGYNYRILTKERTRSESERSYLDGRGLMTGGFAAVAWPAKYGNSGVMTFLVNHRGIVYQKDLGQDTAKIAAEIEVYAPDATWTPTADTLRGAIEDTEEAEPSRVRTARW